MSVVDIEHYRGILKEAMSYALPRDGSSGQPPQPPPLPTANGGEPEGEAAPAIVPLWQFITRDDEPAEAVVGDPEDTLLPVGGMVILGGEGGASKTTLTLDAIAHMCSGTPWLGYPVARPARALLIENEGPRRQFRAKLRAKCESWPGADFHTNVYVWESPWAAFSFGRPADRQYLIDFAADRAIDVVVADPLDSLGIEGAGTPEDVRRFVVHLKDCGLHDPERPLAFWLLHHFNKGLGRSVVQQLSGAWGGHPDAILGVELGDAQTTKLTWGKLRHATPPKEKTVILAWDLETRGFVPLAQHVPLGDDELREKVADYVAEHPGESQSAIEEAIGGARQSVRKALEWLSDDANGGSLAVGPGRAKNGKYYFPSNHAALRSPETLGERSGEQESLLTGTEALASSPPPRRGGRAVGEQPPDAAEPYLGTGEYDRPPPGTFDDTEPEPE